MSKLLAFTLIELIITMTIGAILAAIGISGYMESLRVERRKDAIFALKKAALIILNSQQQKTQPICTSSQQAYNNASDNCTSEGGFYVINYNNQNNTGYESTVGNNIKNQIMATEKLYLKAQAFRDSPQFNDDANRNNGIDCTIIYLSDLNNIYPTECQ